MNHLGGIVGKLTECGLDAMLITSESSEFYALNFHGEGVALITRDGSWYFTDSRYMEAAEQRVTGAHVAMPERGVGYPETIAHLTAQLSLKTLGIEDDRLSVRDFKRWERALPVSLVPASQMLSELRMVKDEEELSLMREAQRITEEAFDEILNFIRPGRTEQEVAARLQYLMLLRGAQRMSFDPIVAAGANGSKPHAVPGETAILPGQFVTMDFGCVFHGYCSDMTRTVAVGRLSEEMQRVYHTVRMAQEAGIAAAHAGVCGAAVHLAGAEVIEAAGYGDFFGHGFGHGLGIEVHEEPRFSPTWRQPIPCGAVLSAEPGIYLPGRFGVRIEDVVVLTQTGCMNLTQAPKDLIIL